MTISSYSLRVRYVGNVAMYSKKGAYGTTSATTSISSYRSINSDDQYRELAVQGEVLVSVNSLYYLVGENGKYTLIRNVRTFTKLFPKYRSQIEAFAQEHETYYNERDDIIALLNYCCALKN